jgi:hypothetical protein
MERHALPYELKDPIWLFVDYWQMLIAGTLAMIAAAVGNDLRSKP